MTVMYYISNHQGDKTRNNILNGAGVQNVNRIASEIITMVWPCK